jgi:hypothetical protein
MFTIYNPLHCNTNTNTYTIHNNRECFICYEFTGKNNCELIELNKQNIYFTRCKCNQYVHIECLQTWLNVNKRCPICSITVIEKKDLYNYILFRFYQCILLCGIFISVLIFASALVYLLILMHRLVLIRIHKNTIKN